MVFEPSRCYVCVCVCMTALMNYWRKCIIPIINKELQKHDCFVWCDVRALIVVWPGHATFTYALAKSDVCEGIKMNVKKKKTSRIALIAQIFCMRVRSASTTVPGGTNNVDRLGLQMISTSFFFSALYSDSPMLSVLRINVVVISTHLSYLM